MTEVEKINREKTGNIAQKYPPSEARDSPNEFALFLGKVAEQKKIRKITDADIAKQTGFTLSAIRSFMCGVRRSERIANAIAEALSIER